MPRVISGRTRLCGVLGYPLEHTLSPRMHNAAFAALGLDWVYLPWPVVPERLGEALRGLRALANFAGANVTVPHKEAVIPHLDELTEEARAVGAVNTIVCAGDRLVGGWARRWKLVRVHGVPGRDDKSLHRVPRVGRRNQMQGGFRP